MGSLVSELFGCRLGEQNKESSSTEMAWGYRIGRLGAGVGIVGILGCSRIENEDVINLKKRILLEVGTLKNPVKFDIFPCKTFSLKAEEAVTEAPKESVSDTVEEIEVA